MFELQARWLKQPSFTRWPDKDAARSRESYRRCLAGVPHKICQWPFSESVSIYVDRIGGRWNENLALDEKPVELTGTAMPR
jgi:hypothetical protein